MMTADDVRYLLQKACEKAGAQNKWAAKHAFTPQFVNMVLVGRKPPSEKICKVLGIEVRRETTYRKVS